MNLLKCENGHFYDADKYDSCPHCNGGAGLTDKTESLSGTMGGTDFFDGDGGNVTVPLGNQEAVGWNSNAAQGAVNGWGNAGNFGGAGETAATVPAGLDPVGFNSISSKQTDVISADHWPDKFGKRISPGTGRDAVVGLEHAGEWSNLQKKIDWAKNGGAATEKADEKTIGYYGSTGLGDTMQKAGLDPVVGWLVCIRGEEFGTSFVLKSGKNFIGRDPKMDVVLAKDRSVSRQCHAIVLYDPKSRMFLVQPGTARELFYLNDKVVLGVEAIQSNDVLSIGKTDLMFVPCCGPNFCWEDQLEKINEEAEKKK